MSQFRVEPTELRAYAQYLRELAGSFDSVNQFARSEGCSTSGFTGLLAVLTPAVQAVGGIYGATLDFGRDRMEGSAQGLERSAENYETTDAGNAAAADATIVPDAPAPVGSD